MKTIPALKHATMAFAVCLGLCSSLFGLSESAQAAGNLEPDYEVKLLLDSNKVLSSEHKLLPDVLKAFNLPDSAIKMNVQFLDTEDQDLNHAGWISRIRKSDSKEHMEITYKKRYPIENNNIDAALTKANKEGFDATDTNYEAQVEWGYKQKTLSISRKKKIKQSGFQGTQLPALSDSIKLLTANIPGKLDKWLYPGWGNEKVGQARIYGPVLAERYTGTWNGLKIDVEIWPIKSAFGGNLDYIVEASFKTTNSREASEEQKRLKAYLEEKGWFLPKDSLKTALILERY
ncbi:hypothetical protein B9C88_19355 [Brevibacillus laterosporus]|uniref:hypothetical protein n=1 Tax=Brevibacillus laterosporus TaxID=1465 RepID=UPI000240330A|nr:hypothetical protein [Brevibacillus laterosporus]PCN42631.1 hypothetical protein B9C88_19355 [Brevibacillus laterosporus]CCF15598.1 putative uncharacterized protein [Brevibacillus laterosporus GI-9]